MKAKLNFILCAVLLSACMAFAANGTGCYTLTPTWKGVGPAASLEKYTLTQTSTDCVVSPMAMYTRPDSVGALNELLGAFWTNSLYASGNAIPLYLGSDIDLGEIAADGSCVKSHTPLTYKAKAQFDGNGYTISNLCIDATEMTGPMGFFDSIDTTTVTNFKIDNVKIKVNAGDDASAYYPVGAVAGKISVSAVTDVEVSNVSIDAPVAGGVFGAMEATTLTNVSATENISVVNNVAISSSTNSKFNDVVGGSRNPGEYHFNVFLGGIAGVAYRSDEYKNSSFVDCKVKATVKDSEAGNDAALGGIVGALASAVDTIIGATVEESEIYGGSAMGGLVGFVSNFYKNSNPEQGNVLVKKSSFSGKIGKAAVGSGIAVNGQTTKNLYAGGLVGYDYLNGESRLEILESQTDLDLTDSVFAAGSYRYRAGGILGASNSCSGSGSLVDSMYVTIKNSSAKGKIYIAASSAEVADLEAVKVYVGGLAGYATVATNGWGIVGDSVSMDLTANVKSSEGSSYVGGMIGYLISSSTNVVKFTDNRFDGHIVVADSLNHVYAGGMIGSLPATAGGSGIDMKNIFVRSDDDLITINSVKVEGTVYNFYEIMAAGGICGYCKEVQNVEKAAVSVSGAIVKASGVYYGSEMSLGGFVGETVNYMKNPSFSGSFSVGNILSTLEYTNLSCQKRIGYVVGKRSTSNVTFAVKSVYHYGANDLDVGPFGETSPEPNDAADDWTDTTGYAYVVRNGSASALSETNNGTKTNTEVASNNFAGFLNGAFAGTTEDPYVWSFETGYNSDLPFFAHGIYAAVTEAKSYKVTFWFDEKTLIGDVQTVLEGNAAIEPEDSLIPEKEGYHFSGWDKEFTEVKSALNVYAVYVIDTFTVTFYDYNDAIISGPVKVTYGGAVSAPRASYLSRVGHTFDHWDDSSYTYVKDTLKIHAVYVPNVYQIAYMVDAAAIDSESVEYGATINLLASAQKDSNEQFTYTFKKWVMADGSATIPETMPDSNITLKAVFDSSDVLYKVMFVDYDGTEIDEPMEVKYGSSVEAPADPSREGYEFVGWDSEDYKNVKQDLVIKAQYEILYYDVVFENYNGDTLKTLSLTYGKAVSVPADPTRPSTAQYKYSFVKWTPTVSVVTADAVYTPVFDSTAVEYTVAFVDYDGTALGESQKATYGQSVTAPADPTRLGYKFTGWDSEDYKDVQKNLVIKAEYEALVYSVVFENYNGDTLKTLALTYGKAVSVPADPTRPSTAQYKYSFVKWTPDVDVATADVVYTPVFDSTAVEYTVAFVDYDGSELGESQKATYGQSVTAPADPTRLGYKFTGWDSEDYKDVQKNLVIKAEYEALVYSVVFENYNGDTLKALALTYGAAVSEPAAPSRASSEKYNYTFKGWTPAVAKATADVVYRAEYDSSLVKYTVVFYVDGKAIEQYVEYGSEAQAPEAPEIAGLTFVGWNTSYDEVIGDLKVYAVYDTNKYTVVFRDYRDSVIFQNQYTYLSDLSMANGMAWDRKASGEYVYTFKGWSETLGLVTRDMDVKAIYDSTYVGKIPSAIQVVEPRLEQSGNAVRFTFSIEGSDEAVTLNLRDEFGSLVESAEVANGLWEMVPAPMGKSYVELSVEGEVVYQDSFEVKSEVVMQAKSWQMISAAALEDGVAASSNLNFYWWDESNAIGDYWQYRAYRGGAIEGTRGFWAGAANETAVTYRKVEGSADSEIQWKLENVYSGWNLVANPYGWYVNLAKGTTDDGSKVTFWRWNSEKGSYDISDVIGPYEAVWAKVEHSTNYRVVAAPVYSVNASTKSVAEKAAAMRKDAGDISSWSVVVTLSDENGKTDSWNMLGAGVKAETMDEPPSGMGDRVNLSIRESARGNVLAKSIKTEADEYEWFLDVSASSDRDGYLVFDGVNELKGLGFSLYVTIDGKTQEVSDGKSVSVALAKESKQVKVRVATASSMTVVSTGLNGFKVAQGAGTLQVGFNAADALAGANGHYALVSVSGKKVASGKFAARAGSNVLNMQAPKSGVYFLQVKVGSQAVNSKVLVK